MAIVQHREVSDGSAAVRWGDHGHEYVVSIEDEAALRKAYRSAVAEGLSLGDVVTDEVDRSIAREIQGEVGIAKDAGGGLIVAYWPSPEVQAQLDALLPAGTPGKEAPGDLHMTLLYLDDEGWRDEGSGWDVQLVAAVCKLFSTEWGPFDAKVGGLGRFVGPEDADVFVALIDCERLVSFRRYLEDALYCRGAVPSRSALWSPQHGFIPHVTLAYVGKGQETLPALPDDGAFEFEVDNITLASGETRIRYALGYVGMHPEEAVEDPRPFYAARDAVALQKAGRVLSERNLQALEVAMTAMAEVVEAERRRTKRPEGYDDEDAATKRRAFLDAVSGTAPAEADLVYAVTKASDEYRFTLGPLYAPDRKDAHGEYTDAETLQKAVWDYVRQSRESGGRLNLQHGDMGEITVAEWVEVMAWPYEHTVKVRTAGGEDRELTMPAGTVYLGAIWDEDAWPLVKAGKIGGWSLGGKAVRVREGVQASDLPSMGDAGLRREAPAQDAQLALLKVAADAEVALRERELDGARKESGRLESIVGQLVDAVKTSFQRSPGDQHSHVHIEEGALNVELPAVSVDVKPEVKLDVVE